jgi:peptide/nickel transport system substrate-binding protein
MSAVEGRGGLAGWGRAPCRRGGREGAETPAKSRVSARLRRWVRLGVGALAVVFLAGCQSEVERAVERVTGRGGDEPAYGDTLVDSMGGNISGLIPNITSDNYSHEVGNLIYNGLVSFDRELNVAPELAESWTISPDCRRLSFRLRRDVKWHDGRPFTAADVLFTQETMAHPKTPSAYKEDFQAVERIEAPDPYTVDIVYRTFYAKSLQSWNMAVLPRHLLEPWMREGKLKESPQYRSRPVGTGPYRFMEWKPGEKVVLVANREYFEGRPYLGRLVYRVIPSQATQFLELKAKGIDAMSLTALQYQRQTDYPAFRKAYTKFKYPSNSYTYFGLNLKDERFADRRVRHAFAHAINKRELIEHVILGQGVAATGPFKPGTWVFNPDVATYPYDPERARTLLAEAGWRERNDAGILVKNGKPFAFELITNQGNDERKKIAEIIQASLREIGVAVEIRTIEWATLLKEWVRKRRFEAIVLGWAIGTDPDQYTIWHSSKTGPDDFNTISFANAEVDELLEKGRATCVQAERARYYHRIHEILAREQPVIFLYFRDALPVVSSRVHGIVPGPAGIRYDLPRWYVPKAEQRYTSG